MSDHLKLIPKPVATIRLRSDTISWNLYAEHIEQCNRDGFLAGSIIRQILGSLERSVAPQLRKQLIDAGIREENVSAYLGAVPDSIQSSVPNPE